MFKQVLSALDDSLKPTIGQINPKELVADKLAGVIQNGLTGIGSRSPILSGITNSINRRFMDTLAIEKMRTRQYQEFMSSQVGIDAGKKIKTNDSDATQKKIDGELLSALGKITKLIDKVGEDEAKKNDIYKKYESYYTDFKKTIDEAAAEQNTNEPARPYFGEPTAGGLSDNLLSSIEKNTKDTANILGKNGPIGSATYSPVTVRGAADQIGGSFLTKVFNEKMVNRLVGAATGEVPIEKPDTPVETVATTEIEKTTDSSLDKLLDSTNSILKNTDKMLELMENKTQVVPEPTKTKEQTEKQTPGVLDKLIQQYREEKSSEAVAEAAAADKKKADELAAAADKKAEAEQAREKQSQDILKNIERQLTAPKKAPEESKTLIERSLNFTKDLIAKRIPGIGTALGRAAGIPGTIATGARGLVSTALPKIGTGVGKIRSLATSIAPSIVNTGSTQLSNVMDMAAGAASYLPKVTNIGKLAAAGGTMLAAGSAVDSTLGAFGVGDTGPIDTDQDSKNWDRSSIWEKIQSAPARAIEKIGGGLFLDNIANEARQKRITSETKYLDEKTPDKATTVTAAAAKEDFIKQQELSIKSDRALDADQQNKYISALRKDPPDSFRPEDIEKAQQHARMAAIGTTPSYSAQSTAGNINAVQPQLKTPGSTVEQLSQTKDIQSAALNIKASQPVIVSNNSTQSNSSAAQQTPFISVATSIRNQDSTFERVQMNDFWPRPV